MDSKLTGWTDPAARLRHALEKDEFELYCQPIVSLAGGERYPMGEVLVRMREEEKALLPPGEFLPVFEHTGFAQGFGISKPQPIAAVAGS